MRLAAQLTGWRIDIDSETKHSAMLDRARQELSRVAVLDEESVDVLVRSGFQTAQELADAELDEIVAILDVDDDAAASVLRAADDVVEKLIMEEAEAKNRPTSDDEEDSEPTPAPIE